LISPLSSREVQPGKGGYKYPHDYLIHYVIRNTWKATESYIKPGELGRRKGNSRKRLEVDQKPNLTGRRP